MIVKKKRNNQNEIFGVQAMVEAVELVLQSAWIKPYNPVSLLIIAKPESAKTSVIVSKNNYDWIYYSNEITAKMLVDEVLLKAQDKKIRILMIPDLLNCTEKQKSTASAFLQLIKSAIEEGVTNIQTYYKKISVEEPIRFGLITAITSENFKKTERYLKQTGLMSRFVPFSYSYSLETINKIFDCITGKAKPNEQDKTKFRKIICKEQEVECPVNFSNELKNLSMTYGSKSGGFGFRVQKRLQKMMKASAILDNRKKVNQDDLNKIIKLSNWFNLDFNII